MLSINMELYNYTIFFKINVKVNKRIETQTLVLVSNGVKQGGVLSRTLFGLYVDGMLEKHKESGYI